MVLSSGDGLGRCYQHRPGRLVVMRKSCATRNYSTNVRSNQCTNSVEKYAVTTWR